MTTSSKKPVRITVGSHWDFCGKVYVVLRCHGRSEYVLGDPSTGSALETRHRSAFLATAKRVEK